MHAAIELTQGRCADAFGEQVAFMCVCSGSADDACATRIA